MDLSSIEEAASDASSDIHWKAVLFKVFNEMMKQNKAAIDHLQDALRKRYEQEQHLIWRHAKLADDLGVAIPAELAERQQQRLGFDQSSAAAAAAASSQWFPFSEQKMTPMSPSTDIVQKILEFADQAEALENRHDLLQSLHAYCLQDVEELKAKLAESTAKKEQREQWISSLTSSLENVQRQLQEGSIDTCLTLQQQHAPAADGVETSYQFTEDSNGDAISDPIVLQQKIKELKQKLITCNERWSKIQLNLTQEIEVAKRKLEEKVANRQQHEQTTLPISLGEWTIQVCRHVEELEQKVLDLERQLRVKHDRDAETRTVMVADADNKMAMAIQIQEYQIAYAQVEDELNRERNQNLSLEIQWQTLADQLQMAREELEKEVKNSSRLRNMLDQAKCDKDKVELCLQSESKLTDTVKQSTRLPGGDVRPQRRESPSAYRKSQKRGTLETDGATDFSGVSWSSWHAQEVN